MKQKYLTPVEIALLLDAFGGTLTEKQRVYAEMHYNEDLSYYEISDRVGITASGVCDIVTRATAKLQKLESATGFVHRLTELREIAERLPDGDDKSALLERL
ncbi:MAG: DNA-binding protein [Oscillospiraceae bacterium]|jgi:predicted DNA-binding protein YlxM (UPF0122 family)|nr:DNA-binding protein [Oscillospiraceae bacterium]